MYIRPKKLDIFIVKQFGTLFIGAFLICQFVLMMQFLWRYVDELIGKGLSIEILAQFFWYMGLMLVPQALPLAILLSSLITFGNLGESSELTAIKAAGISLMQSFRSLIFTCVLICIGSFMFQNYVGPKAQVNLMRLLVSMKQTSPELEIPEGIFYSGIPNSNIYVTKKNLETGKLYGVTIYRMTGSYEDQAIILADSAMMQSTADKHHLLLTLWSGEWFENMQSQELGGKASVPYRRETFFEKQLLIDFDGEFNMADASITSNDARGKGLAQLSNDIDSLKNRQDSVGRAIYSDLKDRSFLLESGSAFVSSQSNTNEIAKLCKKTSNVDSIYKSLTDAQRRNVVANANTKINSTKQELEFRSLTTGDYQYLIRTHRMQQIDIFTLTLQCLLFFFIGAPLGAIIRKGGLGLPVIISVVVFITYYILDNSSKRMVKIDAWNIWFGRLLALGALTPLAVFVTYQANKDSTVFNMDAYKAFFSKLFGLKMKRHIQSKEVVIEEPDYAGDAEKLRETTLAIAAYESEHKLKRLPSVKQVFFVYKPDHEMERISDILESVIDDLGNTRDKIIMNEINRYPVLATKAHTRPFERKWLNVLSAVIVPVGLFLYLRMVRFRLRLHRDLQTVKQTNGAIENRINALGK